MPGVSALQILKHDALLLQPVLNHRTAPCWAFARWLERIMSCPGQARALPVPVDCSSPCRTAHSYVLCLWLLPTPALRTLQQPGSVHGMLPCNSKSPHLTARALFDWQDGAQHLPHHLSLTSFACACYVQQPGSASRMVPLGSKARQQGEGDPFAWTPPPTHGAQQHPPGAGLKAHRPVGQQPHHQQPPKLGAKRLATGGTPGNCPVTLCCMVALPRCILSCFKLTWNHNTGYCLDAEGWPRLGLRCWLRLP